MQTKFARFRQKSSDYYKLDPPKISRNRRAWSIVTNFNTSPMAPLIEKISLDTLNSEQKPSIKKPVDRLVDRPVNRRRF